MLKEVTKREAVMAALDGKLTYRINDFKTEGGIIGTLDLTQAIEKLINAEECSRFLVDEPEPKAEAPADEVPPPQQKKPAARGGRKKIDTGKIMALHRAGWSNTKIADEMNLSAMTVGKYVRQLSESETNED